MPWEDLSANITPEEYERLVASHLHALGRDLPGFRVEHLEKITTPEGDFRIDVTARFNPLGADFLVLIECKRHSRPVERREVQILADKVRAIRAHKGMLFSTNGFQEGAIEYAQFHRIALARIVDGNLTYETRSFRQLGDPRPAPPPWANIPAHVVYVIAKEESGTSISMAAPDRTEPYVEFLTGSP